MQYKLCRIQKSTIKYIIAMTHRELYFRDTLHNGTPHVCERLDNMSHTGSRHAYTYVIYIINDTRGTHTHSQYFLVSSLSHNGRVAKCARQHTRWLHQTSVQIKIIKSRSQKYCQQNGGRQMYSLNQASVLYIINIS